VRIGESSVGSLRVHVLTPSDPDTVAVLLDCDAGQVFYGRRRPGEIVHLDIFHAPGALPPQAVAEAFGRAVGEYRRDFPAHGRCLSADLFDVQTGAGGGRLSGTLAGGRRPTVLAAHRGHVHLAGRLPGGDAMFCFYLVAAVERCLTEAGLPPRRPRRVVAVRGGGLPQGPQGLRDYAALTDSWLREQEPDPGVPEGEEGLLTAAAQLADELGGTATARALLDALARPVSLAALGPAAGCSPPRARDALAKLVQQGWAEPDGALWRLTPRGLALRLTFARRLREVELALRSAARRLATGGAHGLPGGGVYGPQRARARGRRVVPAVRGERLTAIAVSDTAVAAAVRCARGAGRLRVRAEDLRLEHRRRPRRVDMLLLLDASASMEGGRMRAARTLARHLLLTGRDRVGVMAFQERSAVLAVPLTRNLAAAERGLGQVVPAGLTPLAAGLAAARTYLQRVHAKSPLLLLVTDGIPTVSLAGGNPLDEALEEAARLRGSGIALCCIGLEPNERYLADLAYRAGGRLQVVAELRPELLAAVARRERLRRLER
jgi:magnesium chelatase subunit D